MIDHAFSDAAPDAEPQPNPENVAESRSILARFATTAVDLCIAAGSGYLAYKASSVAPALTAFFIGPVITETAIGVIVAPTFTHKANNVFRLAAGTVFGVACVAMGAIGYEGTPEQNVQTSANILANECPQPGITVQRKIDGEKNISGTFSVLDGPDGSAINKSRTNSETVTFIKGMKKTAASRQTYPDDITYEITAAADGIATRNYWTGRPETVAVRETYELQRNRCAKKLESLRAAP